MSLPIAGFGNVTSADAVRLSAALQTAAAGTPGATVRIAGGTALEFTDDRNVWARLEGDVDALKSMARDVTQVVEQHGFFVDRRRFRPLLRVATVTAATTGPFLETVVAALDDFSGEPWVVDQVWLLKAFYGGDATEFEVVDQFPLAPVAVTT
jgi:2'-5' RNA ligase